MTVAEILTRWGFADLAPEPVRFEIVDVDDRLAELERELGIAPEGVTNGDNERVD